MREQTRIRGVCPVLAVPFTEAGDVDLDSFAAMVRHVLATGVSAVMRMPIVLMIRQPPLAVPSPMATAHTIFTQSGI